MWFGLDFRWVSALAYSTDRAGCVSHPTPTRRCTHVGRPPAFVSFLAPSSLLPLHSLTLGIAPLSFSPLLFSPASSLAPLFSLMKVIANQFITKFIICTRNCRNELRTWFADGRQLAGTHLYSCIGFQCKRLVSLILASGNLGHTSN